MAPAQPLTNYRQLVAPTAAGQIAITVQANDSTNSLVLAGMAIQP